MDQVRERELFDLIIIWTCTFQFNIDLFLFLDIFSIQCECVRRSIGHFSFHLKVLILIFDTGKF